MDSDVKPKLIFEEGAFDMVHVEPQTPLMFSLHQSELDLSQEMLTQVEAMAAEDRQRIVDAVIESIEQMTRTVCGVGDPVRTTLVTGPDEKLYVVTTRSYGVVTNAS